MGLNKERFELVRGRVPKSLSVMISPILVFILMSASAAIAVAQSSSLSLPPQESTPVTTTDSSNANGTSSTSIELPTSPLQKTYLIKASLLTSHAGQRNDYRNTKNSSSDDSGQMSENTTLPNMSYFSAMGATRLTEHQLVSLSGLQSLDSPEARTIANPNGPDFTLPGEILAAHYAYRFDDGFQLSAMQIYTDTFHFFDPSVGVGHISAPDLGWGHRTMLNLSIPTTERSLTEHQLTRAFLRASLNYHRPKWSLFAGVGGSKVIYQNTPPPRAGKTGVRQSSSPETHEHEGGGGLGSVPSFSPDIIDIILADRQDGRASTSFGGSYSFSDKLRYVASSSVSYIHTMANHQLWFTTFKPASLTYQVASLWEVGSDLTFYSDIENFQRPSVPQLWNVGVRLGYRFGNPELMTH